MTQASQEKNEILLASGLIGANANEIHGQLTVKYIDYKTVKINLWRKLHSGLPDLEFSVDDNDLLEILGLLTEANSKIQSYWLSKISIEEKKAIF